MKKLWLIAILGLSLSARTTAQNADRLLQAFRTSYAMEAEGNYPEAIQALESLPQNNSYEINLRLGWLYYNKGDFPRSKSYYAKAMALLPYAIEARFGYVLPLAGLGDWESVISTYGEILRIDPQNTTANYRLAAIYYERQDYERAFRHAEIVVNLYPFDHDGVVLFAWIQLRMGRTAKARLLFEKALLINPLSESARAGLDLAR